MTQPQWSGFDGSFTSPGYLPGTNLAEFDLKLNICPIPFLGMEGFVAKKVRALLKLQSNGDL